MTSPRFAKYAPLSGLGSMLILIAAAGLLGEYTYLPSADRLLDLFSENSTKTIAVGYFGLLSAALLLWFSGSVQAALRAHEGPPGRLSMIAFGGGAASSIAIGAGYSVIIALGARAGATEGLGAPMAVTLYDLYGTLLGQLAAFTFAVLLAATGIASLRTSMFPTWFGWASMIIAFGLITPLGYFFMAFVLVWIPGLSISLYRRGI